MEDNTIEELGKKNKAKTYAVYAVVIGIILLVVAMVLRNAANASSGGTTTGGGGGGTTGTTGTSTPTLQDQLTYQQGLAAIQNQQATLAEQLQEQLGLSQTNNAISLSNAQTANSNSAATVAEQLQADLANTQEVLTEKQNASQTANQLTLAEGQANIQQSNLTNTIAAILGAQKASDAEANAQSTAATDTEISNLSKLASFLNSSFTFTNSKGQTVESNVGANEGLTQFGGDKIISLFGLSNQGTSPIMPVTNTNWSQILANALGSNGSTK